MATFIVNTAPLSTGTRVWWVSQSAGIVKTKTGEIVEVIPAGQRPAWKNAGSARSHVSYIVRVGRRRYWPRVSQLQLATEVTS